MPSRSFERDRKFMLCTGEAVTREYLEKHLGSHIIGEVHYMPEEGLHVTALAVYERSRPVSDVPKMMPPIRVHIIGDARYIKCTCCYRTKKRWEIGKNAVSLMMSRFGKFPIRSV